MKVEVAMAEVREASNTGCSQSNPQIQSISPPMNLCARSTKVCMVAAGLTVAKVGLKVELGGRVEGKACSTEDSRDSPGTQNT